MIILSALAWLLLTIIGTAWLALGFNWPQVLAWLLVINLAVLLMLLKDKLFGRGVKHIVPERVMLLLGLLGGLPGLFIGRRLIRHKAEQSPFTVELYVVLTVQMLLLAWLAGRYIQVF